MRTRVVLLLLFCTAMCATVIGRSAGKVLDVRNDYIEAEAMANALNYEAERLGAWPEEKSPLYQGRERLKDEHGQVVLIVNEHFKLRCSAMGFAAQIEPLKREH